MIKRSALIFTLAIGTAYLTGCAVARDQQTVGAFIDDSTITTQVKARFADNPNVSALAIKVETLNGVVQLAGFAKAVEERDSAETIARRVSGVKDVVNGIVVRP